VWIELLENTIFPTCGPGYEKEWVSNDIQTGGQKKLSILYNHYLRQHARTKASGHHGDEESGKRGKKKPDQTTGS